MGRPRRYSDATLVNENDSIVQQQPLADNDRPELYRTLSETPTIVPNVPSSSQPIKIRALPFVTLLMKQGLFCFTSEASLQKYKNNKRNLELFEIDPLTKELVGCPIFQCVSISILKGIWSKSPYIMKIYKYITSEEKLHETSETKHELVGFNAELNLYLFRIEYCSVSQDSSTNKSGHSISRTLHFHRPDPNTGHLYTATLINKLLHRYTDVKISYKPNLYLRWYGTSGFASVFGSLNFKLAIVNQEGNARVGTWASFSDTNATILRPKRIMKEGILLVGEPEQDTNIRNSDAGTSELSKNTEVVCCMCLVIFEFESRKETRRHGRDNAMFMSMGSGPLLF
ncbi:uncharacterized protein SCODWIG_02034 [Saccharomycodes ludwigii]|uniref:Uncharacterized protein n=1 Tax=Saccharomycodes ludwigii TaxID=36035 RepID=A0A376B6G4_9ASCO|nr:hypothetical protein SCDLUD_002951 [Saccharomycodes ludwigii]KAH3901456.1 hypothetical protein SCDLUD_002951 [Saccharomycodes ludwigii]SSD60273.1 uncharacterized protein SCODWIG_02034 [Saccharomycodes ludwigii]